MRILFVDDNRDDIELERRELGRDGLAFEWRTAASEKELRRQLAEFQPHIVLCDYSMPGFSGRAALGIVKEQSPLTPLIFVSGTIGEETAVECLREGAIDYVLKHNPRRLAPAVRRALADVEERRDYEERIRHLANFDALTELPNRALLRDRMEQALVHAERTERIVAVLAINLDGFRRVIQGFGHEAGDMVLREIAARLQAGVRAGDTVSRSGNDEFIVLISDLARPEDVNPFIWRLLEAVRTPLQLGQRPVSLTATAGVALFPADGRAAEVLLRGAVSAMHRAKAQRRGGFMFAASDDVMRESLHRLMMETGLHHAVQRGELRLQYQPQFNLADATPCGVEALVRWGNAGDPVPPGVFIPIAEETGLIRQMGRWILRKAFSQALPWIHGDGSSLILGVNVSALQLHDEGFLFNLRTALHEAGFPPTCLEIELTETAIMKGDEDVLPVLEGLRAMGVRIAIDDFGTGYSSLSYLSRLPIERLKIDASFVRRMAEDPRDAKIAQSIVSLGHALDLKVIAEGVETTQQLEMLRKMECDQVQGYLLGAPMAPEEIPAKLRPRG
jgi:diguanylate cyclase (GGDEF)-like protein